MFRTAEDRRAPVPLLSIMMLGLCLALAGCGGKGSGAATGPINPVGTVADLQKALVNSYTAGAVVPTNADTTAGLLATVNVDALKGATALYLVGGSLQDAGAVTVKVHAAGPAVSELTLDKLAVNVQGILQYFYTSRVSHPLAINLTFDGSDYHRFSNSGTGVVPAFSDSILSVSLPVISAPASGASVVHTSPLTVSWTPMGSDSTVYVIAVLRSTMDSTKVAYGVIARDVDGSTIISSARLTALPLGSARLAVARYRLAYHTYGSIRAGLACEAVKTQDATVN